MDSARSNGRLLLALSVPLLPFSGYAALRHATHDRTSALAASLPLMLALALTAAAFGYLANALDDYRDRTWPVAAILCLSVFAMAVLGFDGALFFTLLTSTSVSVYTLTTMGVFGAATLIAAAALGALIAGSLELPRRRHALCFVGQCVLVVYMILAQQRWLGHVVLAFSAAAFLLGLWRSWRSAARQTGP